MSFLPTPLLPPTRDRGPRRGPLGVTLLELLIVVAIIAIIASIMIPMLLNALQKAKQKRTMAEMHETGKAMTTYFLDEFSGAAAGASAPPMDISDFGTPVDLGALQALLVPLYIPDLRPNDAWGHPFEFYLRSTAFNEDNVMAIRSAGDDNQFSGGTYLPGPFKTTDYSEDLVWADGVFVRWPEN